MNEFLSKSPTYVSGHKFTRFVGIIFFISSVAAYAYASQYLLMRMIAAMPEDQLLYIFAIGLAICWLASVMLLGKWFRYYQTYKPGLPSLIVSVMPLLIIPLAWAMLQGIKITEAAI